MKNLVFGVLFLALFMGLDYAVFDCSPKNNDADPWEETWQKPCKSEASQKEIRAVEWADDSV